MKKKVVTHYLHSRSLSFKYAFNGLSYAIRTQKNAQFHLFATVVVVLLGLFFRVSNFEFCLLFLCISFVWVVELINTALEKTVDLCSPNYHPLAKVIKDLAAGAVLISSFFAAIIGIIIFLPYFVRLFRFI